MNTTRQARTWPYDLFKAIIALLLLALMLYFRPDVQAMIGQQLGLPFGSLTLLNPPQIAAGQAGATLSGRSEPGAFVEVFAGEARLGVATAGADGTWTLPVTLPDGSYQLRAQARDASGALLGAAAVIDWTSTTAAGAAGAGQPAAAGDGVAGSAATTATDAIAAAGTTTRTITGTDTSADSTASDSTASDSTASDSTAADSAGVAAGGPPTIDAKTTTDAGIAFRGKGQPGVTIELVSADGLLGTAAVGPDGAWELTAPLAAGDYEVQARAIDASGAQVSASRVLVFNVPAGAGAEAGGAVTTTAATTGTANLAALASSAEDAASAAESAQASVIVAQVLSDAVQVSGAGAPGTTVQVVAGDLVLGEVEVGPDGIWSLSAAAPPAGDYAVTVRTLDDDGQPVDESAATPLRVAAAGAAAGSSATGSSVTGSNGITQATVAASTTPTATAGAQGANADAAGSDAGSDASTDAGEAQAATNLDMLPPLLDGDRVSFTGTAPPDAAVELLVDGEVLTQTVADGLGRWGFVLQLDPGDYSIQPRVRGTAAAQAAGPVGMIVTIPDGDGAGVAVTRPLTAALTSTARPTATATAGTATTGTATAGTATTGTVASATPAATRTVTATAGGAVAGASTATAALTPTASAAGSSPAASSATTSTGATAAVTATGTSTGTATAGAATAGSAAAGDTRAAGAITATAAAGAAVTTTAPVTAPAVVATTAATTAATTGTATPTAQPAGQVAAGAALTASASATGTAPLTTPAAAASAGVTTSAGLTPTTGLAAGSATTVTATAAAVASATPTLTQPVVAGNVLTLTGSGEPGTTVEVVSGTLVLGKVVVDAAGQWALASTVQPGDYRLQVVRRDAAGEIISQSPVVTLNIPDPNQSAQAAAPATDTADTTDATDAAAPTGAGQAYVIQPGDWLSTLAEQYLGSQARFSEIVTATNEKAQTDPSFATITDPNLIEPGQKVWIPAP